MFQTSIDVPSEFFKEVADAFYDKICKQELIDPIDKPFLLESEYLIDYACIWNKVENVGKTCKILAKNDRIAHVAIEGRTVQGKCDEFYRLQDLSLIVK